MSLAPSKTGSRRVDAPAGHGESPCAQLTEVVPAREFVPEPLDEMLPSGRSPWFPDVPVTEVMGDMLSKIGTGTATAVPVKVFVFSMEGRMAKPSTVTVATALVAEPSVLVAIKK